MKTYCPLPFSHLYVAETGEVKPCCVSRSFKTKPNIKNFSIEEIYNGEEFRKLRKDLTNNLRPNICGHCWELENAGKSSYRLNSTKTYKNSQTTEIVSTQFKNIDIRFSNICNLKCIMCGPLSSHLHNNGVVIKIEDNFLEQLKKHLKEIKQVYFAGGEPLIMDEHYSLVEYLSEAKPDTKLVYSTNLQVLEKGKYKVLELWKKFTSPVLVAVSCDGLFDKGSEIRENFDTTKFINNIRLLRENNIEYKISYTVGSYNVADIPLFLKQAKELDLVDSLENITFSNLVNIPKKYNIQSLPFSQKQKVTKLLKTVTSHKSEIQEIINFMTGKLT